MKRPSIHRLPTVHPFARGFLVVRVLCFVACGFILTTRAAEPTPRLASAAVQQRVVELIQNVLGPYGPAPALTNLSATPPSITNTNIEEAFREASALMPERLDLRFGLASALISQALQTNTQFEVKMEAGLLVYQEIQALDPSGFESAILQAAYRRGLGHTNAAASMLDQLMSSHPEQTRAYLDRFRRLDQILQIIPSETAVTNLPMTRDHAIVILGAGLETNGLMKTKLLARLQKGLQLAGLYPEAPIVVTGGNARTGVTEAHVMERWLVGEGVSTNRVHLEDQARDTVGNAILCCAILRKLAVTHVTLVTSSSHLRRALADFEEAALGRGLILAFSHLAARDEPSLDEARDRINIYRDVLRTSGVWTYPGIQR